MEFDIIVGRDEYRRVGDWIQHGDSGGGGVGSECDYWIGGRRDDDVGDVSGAKAGSYAGQQDGVDRRVGADRDRVEDIDRAYPQRNIIGSCYGKPKPAPDVKPGGLRLQEPPHLP